MRSRGPHSGGPKTSHPRQHPKCLSLVDSVVSGTRQLFAEQDFLQYLRWSCEGCRLRLCLCRSIINVVTRDTRNNKGPCYHLLVPLSLSITVLSTHVRAFIPAPAISWASKKQATVALSSCEAEIVAASEASKEAVHLAGLTAELGMHDGSPVDLHIDNQSAISFLRVY